MASVSFVDELVGDLVKALETLKLNNNTWIVLWSDHGWHLGEKSHWGKATGWYRSTRVPFLIIPPAGSTDYNKAIEIKNMVNLLDLAPTLADIAGIPKKTSWEGRSLMPLLSEEASDWEEVSLTTFSIGSHTISTPDWQLISYFDGSFELYDLVNDPNQFKNIADLPESKIVVEQLKKHIPEEPHWNYFIRYGDYKILIPKNGSIKIFDQMLEGKNDKDMAGALPGLVKKIESYIERYSPQEKKFIIAALE
ncbi:MAG: Arylsulfatase [Flavobacteriaceae bacterium]|nr:MAG: Arylsulfatase [Flavobacteriaceae bacterium]